MVHHAAFVSALARFGPRGVTVVDLGCRVLDPQRQGPPGVRMANAREEIGELVLVEYQLRMQLGAPHVVVVQQLVPIGADSRAPWCQPSRLGVDLAWVVGAGLTLAAPLGVKPRGGQRTPPPPPACRLCARRLWVCWLGDCWLRDCWLSKVGLWRVLLRDVGLWRLDELGKSEL